ncbi:MAG: sugar phosphate isomerase/epimerase family protein [Kineosporiaceae bacterium]
MRLCVITDEISPDFDTALDVSDELGIRTVEIRTVDGASAVAHDDATVRSWRQRLDDRGIDVAAFASPFLKSHLRDGDAAGAPGPTHGAPPATRAEQWGVLERSFEVAHLLGAPLVRTFSFWRLPDPAAVRDEIVDVLAEAAGRAEAAGLELGLENEHACNLATGAEAAWALDRIISPAFGLIWDPGNEAALDSTPYPDGYAHVRGRVRHVQVKDRSPDGRWTRVGTGVVDWEGQVRALAADGYPGLLSLETHYDTPDGGRAGATRESAAALRDLCARAGVELEEVAA